MNIRKRNRKYHCFIQVLFLLISSGGFCQGSGKRKLEQEISIAVKKAYPACVKLFAYDTILKQQTGGQFSGVIVSKDGHILTAAHVETPGGIYKVVFPDAKECLATGLGKIELSADKTVPDAAMMKIITPGSWPSARIGRSSSLKVNEPCMSISYPEGLGQPKPILRLGYISTVKNNRGFIKSSCMMEPGDSGGPLFDKLGCVIGLHSAIEVPEDSNYDVPVDLYLKYWHALNIPKTYNDFPQQTDQVSGRPPNGKIAKSSVYKDQHLPTLTALKLSGSCVMIMSNINGHLQMVNGTLILLQKSSLKLNGHRQVIISKSSLIGACPVVYGGNNGKTGARVLARDKENDLVLLAPFSEMKGGINLDLPNICEPDKIQAGRLLVSPQADMIDIISICGSAVFSMPKMTNAPFLGMGFKRRDAPLTVTYVFPHLNKSIYEVHIGDEITGIDGYSSDHLDDYLKKLMQYWPGDTVHLKIKRAGTAILENIVLDTMPQRHFNHPVEFFAGGKSSRRDGFTHVFTHDAIVTPERCGGPVFDMKGNLYGINIARYSRASCLAIPPSIIYDFIDKTLSD